MSSAFSYPYLEKILIHETTILRRLDELAWEITRDFADRGDLTVIAVMHGSLFFVADLLRRVQLPLRIETLNVASYDGAASTGLIRFRQTELPDVRGRQVLVLDDILDSGQTLHAICSRLQAECAPAAIRTGVLLNKVRPRVVEVAADYVGFDIGDEFVVGYGLDYNGEYRNLPLIGSLRAEYIAA